MNKRGIQRLYEELPQLVAQGVLTPDAADRLRTHYGPVAVARPARLAIVFFGVLGALLIGAGIILLLGHNWENLTRPVRAFLSFLPLLLAQGLGAWILLRRPDSLAWREGAGGLIYLMIGASISLVAQTYNISGDMPAFLLTWSLLGLPLVYLFDAAVPALLYLWCITEWPCHVSWASGFSAGYWLLAALLVPQLVRWLRAGRYQARSTLLLWAFCFSVTVAAGVTLQRMLPGLWIILYAGLFALMFLGGEFWFGEAAGFWARPLRQFGATGGLILAFMLTFEWPWHEVGWSYWFDRQLHGRPAWWVVPDAMLGSLVPLAAIILLVMALRRRKMQDLMIGSLPILAVAGYCVASLAESYALPAGMFDLYLFAAGLGLLVAGIRNQSLAQMNTGLFVVSALLVARFFDTDLGFLLRGLVFIALGIAFLVANVVMLRRKGAHHE